jgi:hypothetical protein
MGVLDIILIVFAVIVAVAAGVYFLNRWASRRMGEQQSLIERTKQTTSIYVIDKAKMKASQSNLPKAVTGQLPRIYRFIKLPLVKAKIGPQVTTLMCDKAVWNAIPLKKTVKVELAGMYIVSMPGMKSKEELKEQRKTKSKDKKA